MDRKKWDEAMQEIDDDIISEAASYKRGNKRRTVILASGIAAAALIIGCILTIWYFSGGGRNGNEEPLVAEEHTSDTASAKKPELLETENKGNTEAGVNGAGGLAVILGDADQYFPEVMDGLKSFSFELFKKAAEKEDGNILISPESVFIALGMTANGARGETLEQMLTCLCGDKDLEKLDLVLNYLAAACINDEILDFELANSIWWDNDDPEFKPNAEFTGKIEKYFDGEMHMADLGKSIDDINRWVEAKTNGMVQKIIDDASDEFDVLLVNALTFDARWDVAIDENKINKNGRFTNSDGKKETATMLTSIEDTYLSDDDTTGFIKAYDGGRFAFAALLPKEGVSIGEYIQELSADKFKALLENKQSGDDVRVTAVMPAFSYDYGTELKDALMSMGMRLPFDDKDADLGAMTENGEMLAISKVLHKTHIDLNENGTRAAASTAVGLTKAAAFEEPAAFYEVILDRPFVYGIFDTETGIPVFLGAVNSVS